MEDYDIVIIGSGIAGSLLAYKLSDKHFKIIILEAGAQRNDERTAMSIEFASAVNKSPGSPFKNSMNYLQTPDNTDKSLNEYYDQLNSPDEYKSTYEKLAGGTTWHWLGNVPRLVPNDFKIKTLYGVGEDWPITYNDLEKWYCEVEREIGVSGDHEEWNDLLGGHRSQPFPMNKIWQSYSDGLIKNAIDGITIEDKVIHVLSTPQARNSQLYDGRPSCAGNSSCVPICPIQAKYDATVHLKKAIKNGVEFREKTIVFKLEQDEEGKIANVHFKNWDNEVKTIKSKIVILAAHAIESSILLLNSNLANSSKTVGKYLMDHLQGYGLGLSKTQMFPFRGPPTTSGIDVFRDSDLRKQSAPFRISLGNDAWGRAESPQKTIQDTIDKKIFGIQLRTTIEDKITRQFRFSYSTEVLPDENNYVTLGTPDVKFGIPRPKINFKVDEYTKKGFEYAWTVMEAIFIKMNLESYTIFKDRNKYSGAGHIMGTTRMGNNPGNSVVNKSCKSHDIKNLYIIGPSVFPTGGTANPTLTVAALTLRLADELKNIFELNNI